MSHQSRCLEPEVKVARSLVYLSEMDFHHLERSKLKCACINLKKNRGETLTHAAVRMSNYKL